MFFKNPLRFTAVLLLFCLLLVACNRSYEPGATIQSAPRLDAGATIFSPKTVRNYTSNIFAKLQVADRAEAIIRARDAVLGRSD